jgi:Polyferredoxin
VGIALLALILLGMALQPRFFCQFLCPMGAVFALLPVLPFAQLHRQSDGCIPGCNACKQQCPVCLKLEGSSLRSGECIACEACAGICPKQNIHRWDRTLCKCLWLPVLVKALLFFLLGCWLGFCRFI